MVSLEDFQSDDTISAGNKQDTADINPNTQNTTTHTSFQTESDHKIDSTLSQPVIHRSKISRRKSWAHVLLLIILLLLTGIRTAESLGIVQLYVEDVALLPRYGVGITVLALLAIWSRSIVSKIMSIIMLVIVAAGFTILSSYVSIDSNRLGNINDSISAFLSGVDSIDIVMDHLATQITIDMSSSDDLLIDYRGDRNVQVGRTDRDSFVIREESKWNILDTVQSLTTVAIPDSSRYSLDIHALYADTTMDISGVELESLRIYGAMSDNDLVMDRFTDDANLTIRSWYSNTDMRLPTSIGVDLYYSKYLGSLNLTNFVEIAPGHYQTIGYDDATQKVTIVVDAVRGNLTIVRQ